jgi:MFS family permease
VIISFWCGLFLGHTGTLVQTTAQSWLIFQLTNSPFYLGLEGFCLGLTRVLFSALGGAIVDRADRKTIFVMTQSAFLLMTLFLGVMDHWGTIRVWHLLTVSALTGFFVSFEQPVRQSILHHLVPRPDLPNAVTLYQMVFNGSMLFGPSLGGMLIPDRYQRLLFRRNRRELDRVAYDFSDSDSRSDKRGEPKETHARRD